MARRRESFNPLLKSYPDSDKINAVSEGAEVLYTRLLAASDDASRYYGDPEMVLGKLFTARMASNVLTARDIEKRLAELESVRLLDRYTVNGRRFVQLLECFKCLRSDVKPQLIFPEPVTEDGPTRAGCGPLEPEPDPTKNQGCCAASTELGQIGQPAVAMTEFVFPTTGKGPKEWQLSQAKLDEYIAAYPGLDVIGEMRKARQWCRDKTRQRKTFGGMLGFLTNWLNRAQNSGGGRAAPQPAQGSVRDRNKAAFLARHGNGNG
jgi:hypothetical protein